MNDPLDAYATVEVVDVTEEAIPLVDANTAVKQSGQQVAKTIPSGKGGVVDRVQEFVSKKLKEEGYDFPLPPYDEILHNDQYWVMLEDCIKVVERYRTTGFDANLEWVKQDLVHLHGNLVYLAGVVGYLKASVDHADSAKKIRRSQTYLFAKTARDALGVSVTDTDATEMASTEVAEFTRSREHLHLAANVLTTSYYAIRSFAEELGKIAQRTSGQEHRAVQHS
jgi:hypothetical protein